MTPWWNPHRWYRQLVIDAERDFFWVVVIYIFLFIAVGLILWLLPR